MTDNIYSKYPYYGNGYLMPEVVDKLPPDLAHKIKDEGIGTEPDFIIASVEYGDRIGYVRRNPMMWNLCGYVVLPESYSGDPEEIECHGGITYQGDDEVGFDCAHAGDTLPSNYVHFADYRFSILHETEKYRDLEYVINEIVTLIDRYEL